MIGKQMQEALAAIHWLETQSEVSDRVYFAPEQIAERAHLDIENVRSAIAECVRSAENPPVLLSKSIKGIVKYRFNAHWRLTQTARELVASGDLEEIEPGRWKLTPKGINRAERVIATDADAALFYRQILRAYGETDD